MLAEKGQNQNRRDGDDEQLTDRRQSRLHMMMMTGHVVSIKNTHLQV